MDVSRGKELLIVEEQKQSLEGSDLPSQGVGGVKHNHGHTGTMLCRILSTVGLCLGFMVGS